MKDSIQNLIHLQECYNALFALSEQLDHYITRLTDLTYDEVEILSEMKRSVDEKLDDVFQGANRMARRLQTRRTKMKL